MRLRVRLTSSSLTTARYPFQIDYIDASADADSAVEDSSKHGSSTAVVEKQIGLAVVEKTAEQRQLLNHVCARSDLFLGLDDDKRDAIVSAMLPFDAPAGLVVIAMGEDGDDFYAVESGEYSVFLKPPTKLCEDDQPVHRYSKGGSFGEMALMYNAPRAATIVTLQPGRLWMVNRMAFRRVQLFGNKESSKSEARMRYIAETAGEMDLHIWVSRRLLIGQRSGGEETWGEREALPGSPFRVKCLPGHAHALCSSLGTVQKFEKHTEREGKKTDGTPRSGRNNSARERSPSARGQRGGAMKETAEALAAREATGRFKHGEHVWSKVKETAGKWTLVAGETLIVRPVIRDRYGNLAHAHKGTLTVKLDMPEAAKSADLHQASKGLKAADRLRRTSQLSMISTEEPEDGEPFRKGGASFKAGESFKAGLVPFTEDDLLAGASDASLGSIDLEPSAQVKAGVTSFDVIRYEALVKGTYKMHILLGGTELSDSPLIFECLPADPSTGHSRIVLPPKPPYFAGEVYTLTCCCVDRFGNDLDKGGFHVSAHMKSATTMPLPQGQETALELTDNANGCFTCKLNLRGPAELRMVIALHATTDGDGKGGKDGVSEMAPFTMSFVARQESGGHDSESSSHRNSFANDDRAGGKGRRAPSLSKILKEATQQLQQEGGSFSRRPSKEKETELSETPRSNASFSSSVAASISDVSATAATVAVLRPSVLELATAEDAVAEAAAAEAAAAEAAAADHALVYPSAAPSAAPSVAPSAAPSASPPCSASSSASPSAARLSMPLAAPSASPSSAQPSGMPRLGVPRPPISKPTRSPADTPRGIASGTAGGGTACGSGNTTARTSSSPRGSRSSTPRRDESSGAATGHLSSRRPSSNSFTKGSFTKGSFPGGGSASAKAAEGSAPRRPSGLHTHPSAMLSNAIEKKIGAAPVTAEAKHVKEVEELASKVSWSRAMLVKLEETQATLAIEAEARLNSKLPLVVRFLEALAAKNMKATDVITSMDWNKDRRITRMEWRTGIRKLVGTKDVDVSETDSVFETIDLDHGGTLDEAELKTALRTLQSKGAQAADERQAVKQKAVHWRQRAEQTRAAIAALEDIDAAEAVLAKARDSSLRARLGAALHRLHLAKNTLEVAMRFDVSGDGNIDSKEFVKGVKALVPQAEASESVDLFLEIDGDRSGSIDLNELKAAMSTMLEAALEASALETKTLKGIEKLRKAAKRAQVAVQIAKIEDDAAAAEAKRAEAEAERDQQKAKEEAKRAAREAKATLVAQAEEERRAFEAKVASRRKSEA